MYYTTRTDNVKRQPKIMGQYLCPKCVHIHMVKSLATLRPITRVR